MRQLQRLLPPPVLIIMGVSFWWLAPTGPQNLRNQSPIEERVAKQQALPVSASDLFVLQPAGDYTEVLQRVAPRPLFAETRKMPAVIPEPETEPSIEDIEPQEQHVEEPTTAPIPPAVEYRGFMRSDSAMRALLADPTTGEENWVSIGDTISEWRVAKVSNVQVHLQLQEFVHVVDIKR